MVDTNEGHDYRCLPVIRQSNKDLTEVALSRSMEIPRRTPSRLRHAWPRNPYERIPIAFDMDRKRTARVSYYKMFVAYLNLRTLGNSTIPVKPIPARIG